MGSTTGTSCTVIDRTSRRTPSPSFGTARTHQSIFVQDSDKCHSRHLDLADCIGYLPHSRTNTKPLSNSISVSESTDGCGHRSPDVASIEHRIHAADEPWGHNTRPHGLPLDTIVEQNSRSTLATRRSVPLLELDIDSYSQRRHSRSLSENIWYDHRQLPSFTPQIIQSDRDLPPPRLEPPTTGASQYPECPTTQNLPWRLSVSGDETPTCGQRRTYYEIREIQERRASTQGNSYNDSVVYQQQKNAENTLVDEVNNVVLVDPVTIPDSIECSHRHLDMAAHKPYLHQSVEELIRSFPCSPESHDLSRPRSNSRAVRYEEMESSEISPLSASRSLGNILAGWSAKAVEDASRSRMSNPLRTHLHLDDPFEPTRPRHKLTVRNGRPDSSPHDNSSIFVDSNIPRQRSRPSNPAHTNCHLEVQETGAERQCADTPVDKADSYSSKTLDYTACDRSERSDFSTPESSLSAYFMPSWHLDISSVNPSGHDGQSRVGYGEPCYHPFPPTPSPSLWRTPIAAPSPLRLRPKQRSNYLLFPPKGACDPSPFVPIPRQWRSFSSMLRLPSSVEHGRITDRQLSCPHGRPVSRPDVYTGRKLTGRWWHTCEYPTCGPEDCRRCSVRDMRLRFQQCILWPCFSQDEHDSEDFQCAKPLPPPPITLHRHQPHATSSRTHERLSTIYSANCSENEPARFRGGESCPHRCKVTNSGCWRCKRFKVRHLGFNLGRLCGAMVDGEDDLSKAAKPIGLKTAMRRSSID